MLTSFASGPPVYYWQIIDIVMCLYFVYKKDDDSDFVALPRKCDKEPKLTSYFPKFPQLR